MLKNIYKTSKAVYHNVGNDEMKLFSFESVSKNLKNTQFTKRVEAKTGVKDHLLKLTYSI